MLVFSKTIVLQKKTWYRREETSFDKMPNPKTQANEDCN